MLALKKADGKTASLESRLKSKIPSEYLEIKSSNKSTKDLTIIQEKLNQYLMQKGYDNYGTSVDVKNEMVLLNIDTLSQEES